MGYWEHYCVGHNAKEEAAAWYYRESDEGEKEYICGNKYNELHEKENWQFVDGNGDRISVKIPTVITANNGSFLCQAAIEGVGLIYTPDFICYKAIRLGQLQPLLEQFQSLSEVPAYTVYPQTRHLTQRVRSLVDYLAQYFGTEPYWRIKAN